MQKGHKSNGIYFTAEAMPRANCGGRHVFDLIAGHLESWIIFITIEPRNPLSYAILDTITRFFSLYSFCSAQKPTIKWGEEFKLNKGSVDPEVIHADSDGVYLQEGHTALKSYFVIGGIGRSAATLIKPDKNLSELYRNNLNADLKGKQFVQFFVLRNQMFCLPQNTSRAKNC